MTHWCWALVVVDPWLCSCVGFLVHLLQSLALLVVAGRRSCCAPGRCVAR
jgi:hypothetical protein